MFQPFEVTISFSLGKGEKDMAKGGVDDFGRKHGNEGAETVKV